jgi:NAD binding domain of 6-phosphogluconate dehydrogenase
MVASSDSSDKSAGNGASQGRSPQQTEIGFIGLGNMGSAIAANLAAADYRVVPYVGRPDQMETLAALGLKSTTKIADVSEREIVTSMLPDDAAVHDVVFGRDDHRIIGLASGLKPGANADLDWTALGLIAAQDRPDTRSAIMGGVIGPLNLADAAHR